MFARTFRSLRHRNYRLYFFGQIVSFTGSWMQSAALMWLVFELTADPLWPPLMLVAAVGPTLLLGPLGGSLADRYPKKSLIFATQTAFLGCAILLTVVVATGSATPVLLLALQALSGMVQAIDLPTRLSFVPELIPKDDLINAVGLNSLTFNLARALGPALAGLLFRLTSHAVASGWIESADPVALGAIACFLFNASSFSAVLVALYFIRVERRVPSHGMKPASFFDGLRFLRDRPGLAGLVLLTGVLSIFAWPVLTLLPAYTSLVLGQREVAYSYLVSALGAGALFGSLTTAAFSTPSRRERFLLTGAGCGLLGLLGLITTADLAAAFVSCAVFGFGLILYLSTGQSTMQLDSPDASRGKVMALWAMTLSGASIPGHILAGLAAQVYPVPTVLFVMLLGVVATVAGLGVLVGSQALRASPRSSD